MKVELNNNFNENYLSNKNINDNNVFNNGINKYYKASKELKYISFNNPNNNNINLISNNKMSNNNQEYSIYSPFLSQ